MAAKRTSEKGVSQQAIAAVLGVTSRQVHNLVQDGMPTKANGGKIEYLPSDCVPWYVKFKIEKAKSEGDPEKEKSKELNRRKLEAEVRTAELELAKLEGSMVSIDYMEQQLLGALQKVRAKLLNFPGRVAPHVMGIKSIPEAHLRLQPMVAEILEALSGFGEELDADEESEEAEPEDT